MAITIRSSATNSAATGTAITVTPGTIKEGDLLVAVIHANLSTNRIADNNGSYPFTEDHDADTAGAGGQSVAVYHRTATASEPASYAWTATTTERWGVMLLAISDADILDPWDCNPIDDVNVASSTTCTADSITATTDDLALYFALLDSANATTFSAPTNGFGSEIELSTNNPMVCYSKTVAAGAVGSTACTASQSNNWAAFLLLVKQRAAGTSSDPETAYSSQEIIDLLTADDIKVGYGLELLDTTDALVEDISADCESGEIEFQSRADICGTARFRLNRELDWDSDRLRPYMTVTATIEGVEYSRRWNLGVDCPLRPRRHLGETPSTWDIEALDKSNFLARPIGDAYTIAASVDYLTAMQAVVTASGMTGVTYGFEWSGTKNTTAALAWVLDSNNTRYLDVLNDLCDLLGYEHVWVDNEGKLRTAPLVAASSKGSVWNFDLSDQTTDVVGPDRYRSQNEFDRTNYWIFIRNGVSALPADGSGLEVLDYSSSGTQYRQTVYMDADSQTELEAKAAVHVEQATLRKTTVEIPVHPLPVMATWGRLPVVDYWDGEAGGPQRAQVVSYRIPLNGDDASVTLEVLS